MAKPCIITYEGKKYDYPTFAAMLHDGLLADLISQGVINDKSFVEEQEQLQKPKKYKELDELSQSELQRKITKSFEDYRQNVLGRNLDEIREVMQQAKEGIKDPKSTDQDKLDYKAVLDLLELQNKRDKSKWMAYKEDLAMLKSFQSDKPVSKMTDEELLYFYNLAESSSYQDEAKKDIVKRLQEEIGLRLFNKGAAVHEGKAYFDKEIASKQDLKAKDISMKNLAHMPEYVPDLQALNNIYEDAAMSKIAERADEHKTLKKVADPVIKEYQKKMGLKQNVSDFVFSDNAKVFDFVEHPEGRYYTLEEAKAKGYSEAQMNYLRYMLHLNELRKKQDIESGAENVVDQVLKVDKKAGEAFRTEGIIQAMSAYLGNSYNIRNVRIKQNGIPKTYGEIEQSLIDQAKKGTIDKLAAIAKLIRYNYDARKQLSKGVNIDESTNQLKPAQAAEYKLSTDGRLKSKFNTKRAGDRGYSKDHYRAAYEFINDYTHVKHMNPILPYVNAIAQINAHGVTSALSGDKMHEKKENVVEWLKQWSDLHLFKSPKKSNLDPKLEAALRTLRKLSSLSTMFFAPTAAAWNTFTGTYNNFRQESGKELVTGMARLSKDWMTGGKNKDILDKFDVISIDQDSNPKIWGGRLLDRIGYMFNQMAETFNQGSMFLGLMTQEEIDSLEYTTDEYGVKKLDFKKGMTEEQKKAFTNKMNSYKTRVSNIHGKYAQKDLRNFMNGELGKAIAQYRVWVPDWWMQRFGDRYYDNEGIEHIGSYRAMFTQGMSELFEQIKTQGLNKGLINNDSAEAKALRSNLKGAMVIAALASLSLGASDDDEDKVLADNIDKALGQILFVFDPSQDKFMTSNPVAALGAANKLFTALNDVKEGKLEKAGKEAVKLIPRNKVVFETEKFLEED